MNYDVIEVQSVEHLHLSVKFRDGLEGKVIFKESHLNGVFETLKNPDIFSLVNCSMVSLNGLATLTLLQMLCMMRSKKTESGN